MLPLLVATIFCFFICDTLGNKGAARIGTYEPLKYDYNTIGLVLKYWASPQVLA